MKRLKLHQDWLKKLLPEGLSYPTSTLISGPGGSGKPLIGFAFVYDWLKSGGSVIFITLQYPKTKFVKTSLKRLYDLNVDEYTKKLAYIQFDHDIDTWEKGNGNTIKANLLKPDVWEEAVNEAEKLLADGGDLGTLLFASALNLLLFSHTYRKLNLDKFEKLLSEDKNRTYIFSVSTSAFREDIKRWEKAADNLMFARLEEPMKLYLRIDKMENKKVPSEEIPVPMKKEILEEIKEVAESTRKREIPKLRKF
ncbi:MAG: ATPase domain-containing protein [candidate division WOR-3 bacterium]|nr:ATPase domain-containing protein [candidate division WOR-3 bacterium]